MIERAGKIYAEQVPAGRPWHGLWRFPDFDASRMIAVAARACTGSATGITKYAVTMSVVAARWRARSAAKAPGRYLTPAEIEALPFAAAAPSKLARWLADRES